MFPLRSSFKLTFLSFFFLSVIFPGCLSTSHKNKASLNTVQNWSILLDYQEDRTFNRARAGTLDMVILDPSHHPPFTWFRPQTLRIAYLSLGEAEVYRAYWPAIENKPWVLGQNPDWAGNFRVDVRAPEWLEALLKEIETSIVNGGFQGIFLDTLDIGPYLDSLPDSNYPGSTQAMIRIVQTIRSRYPGLLLISNNGFEMLENLGPLLDGVLAEDLYSMPDFAAGGYTEVSEDDRTFKITRLQAVKKRFKLPVFIIDYLENPKSPEAALISEKVHALGFSSRVTTKDLTDF